MTKGLDIKIKKLRELEEKINVLEQVKELLRKEIFAFVEKENLDQYKVDGVATISKVERMTIRYSVPEENIIAGLKESNWTKYLKEVPEIPAVPATTKLNEKFIEDIKSGGLIYDGVEVINNTGLMIRFDK